MAISPKTKVKVNVVAFVVLGVGLSYAMATQVLSVLANRYKVIATFPDAGGVFTNQEVTYRGITVGQVGNMSVVEEGVDIELLIDEDTKIPAEDVHARVMFKSAVGEQFVDILPASDGGPYLSDGSRIPIEQTSIPVSTQDLLSTLQEVLEGVPPEALKGAIDSAGEALAGRGDDIATILDSMARLAELFAERAPEVRGILRNGTEVGEAFVASREDFAAAVRDLVIVSETLEGSTDDLRRLLEGANVTSEELVGLIRESRPDLHQTIAELAEINEIQAEKANALQALFEFLPRGLGNVVKTFEPATGMIRFGLVTDTENHACSYGTERRQPEDRGPHLPPKNARCSNAPEEQQEVPSGASLTPSRRGSPALDTTGILGLDEAGVGTSRLPNRMSDWSWTLVYLNSL
ncbi:MAG TPA: MCE family protein [Actinomycetota bacterium]|nr:MCE family protein [Actinomycetota bacterium]